MKIEISKKQYETLIKATEAASSVYGILGDTVSEDYKEESNNIDNLQNHILGFASEFGYEEMVEKFRGEILLSDEWSDRLQEVMDDYDDETFWHELEIRLGKRDLMKTITKQEQEEMEENGGWYPDRIHNLYNKWSEEFENYGIDRLDIVVSKNSDEKFKEKIGKN